MDRYAYLPTDLQRTAVFKDRADFLRKLQKTQRDREYRHIATHAPPPLRADTDLGDKLAALTAELADLKRRSPGTPSTAVPSTAPGTRGAA